MMRVFQGMIRAAAGVPPQSGNKPNNRIAPANFRLEALEPRVLLSADVVTEVLGEVLPNDPFLQNAPLVLSIDSIDSENSDNTPVLQFDRQSLQPLVDEALTRLQILDVSPQLLQDIRDVEIEVADLPEWTLAETTEEKIRIDWNGGGIGWFVDETPADDIEFQQEGSNLVSEAGGPAENRIDLLTVLVHEIGHILGLDHTESGFMQAGLRPGIRRAPDKTSDSFSGVDSLLADQLVETLHTANGPPSSNALSISPTISWNVDTDGFWDVPGNWLDIEGVSRLPNASDDVLIRRDSANPIITISSGSHTARTIVSDESIVVTGGNLALGGDAEIDADLSLTGGTLTLNGVVTVTGTLLRTGTTITGKGAIQAGRDIIGIITLPGETDNYSFTLTDSARLYFDVLSPNNPSFLWSLAGPLGTVVNSRSFQSSDSHDIANPVLNLIAGSYTLTIDANLDNVGTYSFRILNLAVAPVVTPGTPVSGTLTPAVETDIYKFSAVAGDKFVFDVTARSGGGSAQWALVDPFGNQVFDRDFGGTSSDSGPHTLSTTGVYTILIEGSRADVGSASYTFNVVFQGNIPPPPPPTGTALIPGTTISGSIGIAGETDTYIFTLSESTHVYFDSLTNNSSIFWYLIGPPGTVVSSRSFTNSDSIDGSVVLNLLPGNYSLGVFGSGSTTGDYSFRLVDLSGAVPLTLGTPVSGTLNPAMESDLYKFDLVGGEKLFFDTTARVNGNSARWRLLDPYLSQVFEGDFNSTANDVGPMKLARAGTYTLILEGRFFDSTPGSYTILVVPVSDELNPITLTLGGTVSEAIDEQGEMDTYTFTLSSPTRLYFDSLTNNGSIFWLMNGPSGSIVSSRPFSNSDSIDGPVILNLIPGTYSIGVFGSGPTTGGYSFRLLNLADALPLVLDSPISGTLNPANESDLYQFEIAGGEKVYFDVTARGNGNSSRWRLLDPYLNVVFETDFNSIGNDVGPLTLSRAGTYTLILEGRFFDTVPGSYTVIAVTVSDELNPVTLTIGGTVSEAIDEQGETDTYTFTLASPTRLYFDSLTNNSSILWYLNGPAGTAVGSRAIPNSDSIDGSVILDLLPGNYSLGVFGIGATTGTYSFRLINLASALPLTLGTPFSGTLSPANESDFYKFDIAGGEKVFFDVTARSNGNSSRWRLLDPYLNVVFETDFNSIGNDVGPLTLSRAGTYTLILEGRFFDATPGSYTAVVVPVSDELNPVTLTIGSTVTEAVDEQGETDTYTFTLESATRVYFDSFTNNGSIFWYLIGPGGTVVGSRPINSSDAIDGSIVLNLLPGTYSLGVFGSGAATGAYSFRWINLADALPLTMGVPFSGTLNPANESDLYQFDAGAGDKVFFDVTARSNGNSARWRLLDPYLNVVFETDFNSIGNDVGPLTLSRAGTYTLILEGRFFDTVSGSYTVIAVPVTDEVNPVALTLGATINEAIDEQGENDRYTFTVPTTTRIYFDSLTNNGSINWYLVGPPGVVSNPRAFTGSDAIDGITVLELGPGNYSLIVYANGSTTGSYSFRLQDLADALPLTLGTPVSGTLNPANESDLYRFDIAGGERVFFDVTARSSGNSARWRLLDPYLNVVFETDFNTISNDVGPLTLTRAGTYTLILEGRFFDTTPGSYTVVATHTGTDPVPPFPTGTPLTPENTINDSVSVAGEQDIYTFTLLSGGRFYFDVLSPSNSNFVWSLVGPSGTVISNRTFTGSDSHDIGNPVLSLIAGNYALTISANGGTTGAYSFRLLDLAAATLIAPGTPVSGVLNPATRTELYRFTVGSGSIFYFDVTARNGGGNAQWALVDTFGNQIFDRDFGGTGSDSGPLTLTTSGTYTLLIEGSRVDAGTTTYTFNVVPVSHELNPVTLALNAIVSEAIDEAGEVDTYTFSLAVASRLVYDVISPNSGSFNWSLVGPSGTIVSNRSFQGSDSHDIDNPLLLLIAGDYTLSIDGVSETTGSYSFRLVDLADAIAITPGTSVSGILNPSQRTDLYRFNATSGDIFYFDVTARSGGGNAQWALVDPFGKQVFDRDFGGTGSDSGPLTLSYTGTYTLLIEGSRVDTATASYTFNVVPVSHELNPVPLVLNAILTEAIDEQGEVDSYNFALAVASRLVFDVVSPNSGSFTWSLVGPSGTIVSSRNFQNSDSHDIGNPLLFLIPGNYTLSIDGITDFTGSYSVRLMDLADAVVITPGTFVSGILNPATLTNLYRFNANSGDIFYFDVTARTGGGSAQWALVDPFGNQIFDRDFGGTGSDSGPLTLSSTGTYTLLIEGSRVDIGTASYTFNVVPVTHELNPVPLTLNGTVSEAIDEQGEVDSYTFFLGVSSRLYFDVVSPNGSSFTWSLSGPSGTVVSGRNFQSSDSHDMGNPVLSVVAGNYTLSIDGNTDTIGSYSFRLLNLADATSISPGIPVSGVLNPATRTDLYRFSATAADIFYFDITSRSGGGSAQWALVNPFGNQIFDRDFGGTTSDSGPHTLPYTGTYTLLIEGSRVDTGAASYTFNLVQLEAGSPILIEPTPLTVLSWGGGGDGVSWNDPLNWSTNAVPGVHDAVQITNAGTFTIFLASDVAIGSLKLGGTSGKQTLSFAGHDLIVASITRVGANGILNVGTGSLTSGDDLESSGAILLTGGSVTAPSVEILSNGSIKGSGNIAADFINSGIVSPDSLAVDGTFTNTPAGVVSIDIAGISPADYDHLSVSGLASLGGTLRVSFVNGFLPAVGDTFSFLTFAASTGAFTVFDSNLVGLGGSFTGGGFGITVTSVANGPVVWDGGGDGVSWNDPLNWNPNRLPGELDDVTIGATGNPVVLLSESLVIVKSLTIAGTLQLLKASLTTSSGTLLTGKLVVLSDNDDDEPSVSDIAGTLTTTVTSQLIIDSGVESAHLRFATGFTNNGLIEFQGSLSDVVDELTITSGVLVNAAITGRIRSLGTHILTGAVENRGEITTTGTNASIRIRAGPGIFTNFGTLAPGTSGHIAFEDSTYVHEGGTLSGQIQWTNSTVTLHADITPGNIATFTDATINGPFVLRAAPGAFIDLFNVTVNSPLEISGHLEVRGENTTTRLNGAVTTFAGSTLTVDSGSFAETHLTLIVANGFTNNGRITLANSKPLLDTMVITNGVLINAAGATIESSGLHLISGNIQNQGTVTTSGTGSRLVFELEDGKTFTNSGSLTPAAGGNILFDEGTYVHLGGTLSGVVNWFGSVVTLNADLASSGNIKFEEATIGGSAKIDVQPNSILTLNGSTVNAPIALLGTMSVEGGGTISRLNGALTTGDASQISMAFIDAGDTPLKLIVANGFTNHGTIFFSRNNTISDTLEITNGVLINAVDATIQSNGVHVIAATFKTRER